MARSDPGAPLPYAYDELRRKGQARGADAVIRTAERSALDRTPAAYDPPARLGNLYPGVLDTTQPGGFPRAGRARSLGGRYFEVEGIAIRYVD